MKTKIKFLALAFKMFSHKPESELRWLTAHTEETYISGYIVVEIEGADAITYNFEGISRFFA